MAATSGAIRAGKAFVEIFGDDTALQKTLENLSKRFEKLGGKLKTFGLGLTGLGAGIVTPLIGATIGFAKVGASLDDASKRTGVSAEALGELSFAAEQSGASLVDVEAGLRGLAKFSKAAGDGGKKAVATLNELGLSFDDLQKLSPDQQMTAIAAALARVDDPVRRAALAMQIFGKSGSKLLPLFSEGASGMAALREQARSLGIVLSGEDVASAAVLDDQLAALGSQLQAVGVTIGAAVAPFFSQLVALLSEALPPVLSFIRANGFLIGIAAALGAALLAAGAAIAGLGFVLSGIGVAVGALATAIGFLLSPIGLVAAALAGLGAWFVSNSTLFSGLAADATGAFGAIRTALAGGDLGAAAAVAWSLIKLEWAKGVAYVSGVWSDLTAGLRTAWIEATSFITETWLAVQNALAKGFAYIMSLFDSSVSFNDVAKQLDAEFQAKIDAAEGRRNQPATSDQAGIAAAEADLQAARAEYEKALAAANDVKAVETEKIAKAEEKGGGNLGALGGGAVASTGTFSSLGEAALGPNGQVVSLLEKIADGIQDVADNTTTEEG